ncbi:hypothetical protein FB558_0734 [Pseudonocardia kunmingensis]|uniref:Uncharacterized protein n=1 Tax=Pseudonocardia kunmingensis TaxID=630975 RepID=A0A543DXB6_9PSEU|nr:hypothetical protein FB558_0734 [Pseudonocardia kunmingensis]
MTDAQQGLELIREPNDHGSGADRRKWGRAGSCDSIYGSIYDGSATDLRQIARPPTSGDQRRTGATSMRTVLRPARLAA